MTFCGASPTLPPGRFPEPSQNVGRVTLRLQICASRLGPLLNLKKKRAPRLCKMFILGPSGLPRGVREPHPNPCVFTGFLAPRRPWGLQCFHRIFWFLKCLEDSKPTLFSQVLWLPKHCVFIGCWLLGGPGNSKTLCFQRFLCLSGALGVPKPYVTSFRAPRVAWGLQTLCVSHVFWLVGGTGVPKPIVFIGVLASRKPWGLENAMEFKSIRALRWT